MARNQQTAGAFDIRNVIGGLIGIYGVALTIAGLFGEMDDLWGGVAMLVFGIVFLAWARVRPVVVDTDEIDSSASSDSDR